MPERYTLPPVITASTWQSVWGALWEGAQRRRGVVTSDEGTVAPRLTNREAVAVVEAARRLKGGTGLPLAGQYEAAAYGWEPPGDLVVTPAQADGDYPADAAVLLQLDLMRLCAELDGAAVREPRFELTDRFDEAAVQSWVRGQLAQEFGPAWKIPLPACRDPKTGRPARPVRGADGRYRCPGGGLTIDDPLTTVIRSLAHLAILVGIPLALVAMYGKRDRRR